MSDRPPQIVGTDGGGKQSQRLILELTRERQKWLAKVEEIEGDGKGCTAAYERGVCWGLNHALNRLERSDA